MPTGRAVLIAPTPSLCVVTTVLLRIHLSCKEFDVACSALQEIKRISMKMNQPFSLYFHSFFTTVDQIALAGLWGPETELSRWASELDLQNGMELPLPANAKKWHGLSSPSYN